MNKEKIVYVPKSWTIPYTKIDGKDESIVVYNNAEYAFTMDDGANIICTIDNVTTTSKDGVDFLNIHPKTIITPGIYTPVVEATEEDAFSVEHVVDISRVVAEYVRDIRSIKDIDNSCGDQVYTFAFNTERYPNNKYMISILDSEFVVLNIRNPRGSREDRTDVRKMFGHIISFKDGQIVFERYLTLSGCRSTRIQKYNVANLLGVYRYRLEVVTEEEAKNRAVERAKARADKFMKKDTEVSTDTSNTEV